MNAHTTSDLPALPTFGERLHFALMRANLSQSELARVIDVTPQAIQKLLQSPLAEYKGRNLERMGEALGISPQWLSPEGPKSGKTATPRTQPSSITDRPLAHALLTKIQQLVEQDRLPEKKAYQLLGQLLDLDES